MAHIARAAGTDYAVAGGKTLIDGTAYSVVATKENEKIKVIMAETTGSTSGNLTVTDDALDWDKYTLKMLLAYYNQSISGTDLYLHAYLQVDGVEKMLLAKRSSNIQFDSANTKLSVDTSVNGMLKVTQGRGTGGTMRFLAGTSTIIVLEAKT